MLSFIFLLLVPYAAAGNGIDVKALNTARCKDIVSLEDLIYAEHKAAYTAQCVVPEETHVARALEYAKASLERLDATIARLREDGKANATDVDAALLDEAKRLAATRPAYVDEITRLEKEATRVTPAYIPTTEQQDRLRASIAAAEKVLSENSVLVHQVYGENYAVYREDELTVENAAVNLCCRQLGVTRRSAYIRPVSCPAREQSSP